MTADPAPTPTTIPAPGDADGIGPRIDAVFDEEFLAVVAASGPWPTGTAPRRASGRGRRPVRVGTRPRPPGSQHGVRPAGRRRPAGGRHRLRPDQRSPPPARVHRPAPPGRVRPTTRPGPIPRTVVGVSDLAAAFETHRPHLVGVGYRITGSLADAEDAAQEAWLRLSRLPDPGAVRDLRGWLTTAVARLCLDRLRSAAARREQHVGPWLPEPVVGGADPALDAVLRADDVRMAAMLVLERLSPDQRVAFVLHEALDLPFAEIAGVLGCTEATARQRASRARQVLADAPVPPPVPDAEAARVLARFGAALATGDARAVAEVLHPDVVFVSDGGGAVRAALHPVHGPAKVARLLVGLAGRGDLPARLRPATVNGAPGWLLPGPDGDPPAAAAAVAVRDGRIVAIYGVLDPSKLR